MTDWICLIGLSIGTSGFSCLLFLRVPDPLGRPLTMLPRVPLLRKHCSPVTLVCCGTHLHCHSAWPFHSSSQHHITNLYSNFRFPEERIWLSSFDLIKCDWRELMRVLFTSLQRLRVARISMHSVKITAFVWKPTESCKERAGNDLKNFGLTSSYYTWRN